MTNVNNDLIEAARDGSEESIKTLLLDPECTPKDADRRGWNALMYAVGGGHTSCVQLLLPVSDALAKDRWGWTALMCAAASGHVSCVQLLLLVSDALAKDNAGVTALMCAASGGHAYCTQMLLTVSDCSARNVHGETASELATDHGYLASGRLIDAYALSVTKRALLDSSTSCTNLRKSRSPRV